MTAIDFTMPSLGADMDSGTITEWMVGVGDSVARGDIVAIVETDKADIDIEVWDSGTVTEIVVPVGELVSVGTPIARLDVAGAEGSDQSTRPDSTQAAPEPMQSELELALAQTQPQPIPAAPEPAVAEPQPIPVSVPAVSVPAVAASGTKVAASPLVRRLVAERGMDLVDLRGSGPGGAIIARDLPAESKPTDPSERMRRAIAELMTRSKREIPHYYLETEIDLETAVTWLESSNVERSVDQRILPAALLMKAVALALAKHQEFNGFWADDRFKAGDGIHLGIAVSLRGGGLVAPAIRHADQLSVEELMAALRDLVGRARSGRLRASEMTDPTVTVTNLGDRGVEVVNGVIYRPQVALIGVGRIDTRPAVIDGNVVPRRRVTVTLAADHRASDGQRGARLLNTIDRLLQKPEEL